MTRVCYSYLALAGLSEGLFLVRSLLLSVDLNILIQLGLGTCLCSLTLEIRSVFHGVVVS